MTQLQAVDREWQDSQREWEDPSNWRGGMLGIYYAPNDPRVIVRKPWLPGGWTLNFARPASWLCVGGLMLVSALFTFWAAGGTQGL